jgi:hypothetical protein
LRGEGSKLGEPCPKVRLSQDGLTREPFHRRANLANIRSNDTRYGVIRLTSASRTKVDLMTCRTKSNDAASNALYLLLIGPYRGQPCKGKQKILKKN